MRKFQQLSYGEVTVLLVALDEYTSISELPQKLIKELKSELEIRG